MANERGFAMGVAVRLREDYAAAQLRGLARQSHDAGQTRRLLAQWVFDQFAVSISQQTLSRERRVLGFRKLSARPRHHAQDGEAVAAFKKTSSPAWTRSPDARHRASR